MLNISLRKVDRHNYEAICDLEVTPEQEDYVACNMWSLVEAAYNEGYVCRGIYQDEEPVGFIMYVLESSTKASIWRFMVDQQFQNKGIGRIALNLAIDEIKHIPNLREIEICYQPDNPVAAPFYQSFGFKEVGMDEDGDDMLAVITL